MFKNVLVGVDATESGRDAIALATQLSCPGVTLTLANVHCGELHPLYAVQRELLDADREASRKLLERELSASGLVADLRSVAALTPGAGLHQQAERQSADLVVVGSSRHGALGRALLTDHARAALNGASCAVAIAARGYAHTSQPIAEVGVAYNGSPESVQALALAREVAGGNAASLHVLEVCSLPAAAYSGFVAPAIGESIELMVGEAQKRMDALADVEGKAVFGLPGEELAAFSGGLDLLVVGSRSYGPIWRLVLGSTSNFLASHARCSLLVLPRSHRFPAGEGLTREQAPAFASLA